MPAHISPTPAHSILTRSQPRTFHSPFSHRIRPTPSRHTAGHTIPSHLTTAPVRIAPHRIASHHIASHRMPTLFYRISPDLPKRRHVLVWCACASARCMRLPCACTCPHACICHVHASTTCMHMLQVLSGLFTYMCSIALPWRVANACHLYVTRKSEPREGIDFYGDPSKNVRSPMWIPMSLAWILKPSTPTPSLQPWSHPHRPAPHPHPAVQRALPNPHRRSGFAYRGVDV